MVNERCGKEVQRRWVEVVKLIAENSSAKVRCPSCNDEILTVQDVVAQDDYHIDRYLRCPKCGAKRTVSGNVRTMKPQIGAIYLSEGKT